MQILASMHAKIAVHSGSSYNKVIRSGSDVWILTLVNTEKPKVPTHCVTNHRLTSSANSGHVPSLQGSDTPIQEADSLLALLYWPNQICTSETGVTLPRGVSLYHAIIVRSMRVKRSPLGVTKASFIGLLKSHHSTPVLREFRFRWGVKSQRSAAHAYEAAPSWKIIMVLFCSKETAKPGWRPKVHPKLKFHPLSATQYK